VKQFKVKQFNAKHSIARSNSHRANVWRESRGANQAARISPESVGNRRGQLLLFAQLFQDRHQQAVREICGFRANFAHDFRKCERPVSIAFRPFEEFVRGLELAPNDLVRALPALAVLVELAVEL